MGNSSSEFKLILGNFFVFWLRKLVLQSRNEFGVYLNTECSYFFDYVLEVSFGVA